MTYTNLAAVQFKRAGKIYYFTLREHMLLLVGDMVVVDTDRGLSLAKVVHLIYEKDCDKKIRPIIRKATPGDLKEGRISADKAQAFVQKKIIQLALNMKVLKVEVQFSGNKIVVYFSAPGRVDFRKLVKEIAAGLRLRVELKQVGPRNETKLLGGMGVCGREYCCSSFLRDFLPVSTRMAKNQNLALNPGKVSGGCGRLLCCLKYENDTYTELRRKLPERGALIEIISTNRKGTVSKVDLLNEMLLVESENNEYLNVAAQDVKILQPFRQTPSPSDDDQEWGDDLDLKDLV